MTLSRVILDLVESDGVVLVYTNGRGDQYFMTKTKRGWYVQGDNSDFYLKDNNLKNKFISDRNLKLIRKES